MSMKTDELISIINSYAPRDLEEEWDNSGWQINLGAEKVEKILVALEITNDVIDEAIEENADFILTHHPLIFGGLSSVKHNKIPDDYIIRLIKSGKSVYSTHTSFDSAFGGINDDLAERVGLHKVRKLHAHKPNGDTEDIMGRMGEYEASKTFGEVCEIVKEALNIDKKLSVVGDPNKTIKKVAVCGGAGADAIPQILNHCDLFITGDVKHHQAQMAKEGELCLINAGHYDTEKFFAENMSDKLDSQLGDKVEITESVIDLEAFKLL